VSPLLLDLSWTFNLNFERVYHCIGLEGPFGTGDQFSLFWHSFASSKGSPSSPFSSLLLGEKNCLSKGLDWPNSFSSLSFTRAEGRRRSWQVGPPCQWLILEPMGSFVLIQLLCRFGAYEPYRKDRCGLCKTGSRITKGSISLGFKLSAPLKEICLRAAYMSLCDCVWVPLVRLTEAPNHEPAFSFNYLSVSLTCGSHLSASLFNVPNSYPGQLNTFAMLLCLCVPRNTSRSCFIFIKLNIWRYVAYFISKFMVFSIEFNHEFYYV